MASTNASPKTEMNENSQSKSKVVALSRFEKMVETGIWTNRLNKRLNIQLAKLSNAFKSLDKKIDLLTSTSTSNEQRELVSSMKQELDDAYLEVLPEVIEIAVVAADNVFTLDSRVKEERLKGEDARQRAALLEDKLSKTFFERLIDLAVYVKKGKKRTEEMRVPEVDSGHYAVPGYYDVNNSDSGFAVFNNWVSVFHVDGHRYGSGNPILHDALHNFIEFHQCYSVKDKTVLELGPFEGANTKQLVDLGAKHVVALEANPEAFLKCLVVKNELKLDNVTFEYGDFNVLLGPDSTKDMPQFDCVVASGMLYHMEDPLYTIDLITATAPVVYVWSQIASDARPNGEWLDIKDSEGRQYRVRENHYDKLKHWGGVGRTALWLTSESIQKAFTDRGFEVTLFDEAEGPNGRFISFLAKK